MLSQLKDKLLSMMDDTLCSYAYVGRVHTSVRWLIFSEGVCLLVRPQIPVDCPNEIVCSIVQRQK